MNDNSDKPSNKKVGPFMAGTGTSKPENGDPDADVKGTAGSTASSDATPSSSRASNSAAGTERTTTEATPSKTGPSVAGSSMKVKTSES